MKEQLIVDLPTGEIDIPHLGVTIRTLMGAAANAYVHHPRKRFTIVYKGAKVATIRLGKDFPG